MLKVQKSLLKFHNLGDLEKSWIVCFSDAAFANLKNGGSEWAFIIFLYGNNKYVSHLMDIKETEASF